MISTEVQKGHPLQSSNEYGGREDNTFNGDGRMRYWLNVVWKNGNMELEKKTSLLVWKNSSIELRSEWLEEKYGSI